MAAYRARFLSRFSLRRQGVEESSSPAEEPGKSGLPARKWELAGYGALLVMAAAMRLWDLGSRAIHHDESLHAFYSWILYQGDGYQHIPMMHGPFQFEANAGLFFVFGDSDYTARLLYALLGTALVALPFFFRHRLSRVGALFTATLLAFSPTMLYFSRFARNDILMVVWTLGLIIAMWRYIDEGKNRYLYIASALLALAFATKETAYILTIVLVLFLALMVAPGRRANGRRPAVIDEMSPPAAVWNEAAGFFSGLRSQIRLSGTSRPAAFLIVLVTLSLPLWSALVSYFQDTPLLNWSNLVLASTEASGPIGAATGGGLVIAFLVVFILLVLSFYWGLRWNRSVWWRCAAIFYGVWVVLYTTFFTNIVGIGSGMWQSLGYWLVQQGEARGGQPIYYYFVITPLYEFLPLLIGLIAAVFYLRRRDTFAHFLVFWAVATFILYTTAGEKMPWLLVNISLPFIVLSGKFLADVVERIEWRRLASGGAILLLPGVPLFLVIAWRLSLVGTGDDDAVTVLGPLLLGAALVGLVVGSIYVALHSGTRNTVAFALIPLALTLFALSIWVGSRASYQNGDIPVEMIVYTQTSPDIPSLVRNIKRAGDVSEQGERVAITIDQTSGFSWPWAWYLREYGQVDYPAYDGIPLQQAPEAAVLLVHSQNKRQTEPLLAEGYGEGRSIKHRWWFPEETYRDLTPGKFLRGLVDRQTWRSAMDYFIYRKGVSDRLGSEDAYVYFDRHLPQTVSTFQQASEE